MKEGYANELGTVTELEYHKVKRSYGNTARRTSFTKLKYFYMKKNLRDFAYMIYKQINTIYEREIDRIKYVAIKN